MSAEIKDLVYKNLELLEEINQIEPPQNHTNNINGTVTFAATKIS